MVDLANGQYPRCVSIPEKLAVKRCPGPSKPSTERRRWWARGRYSSRIPSESRSL